MAYLIDTDEKLRERLQQYIRDVQAERETFDGNKWLKVQNKLKRERLKCFFGIPEMGTAKYCIKNDFDASTIDPLEDYWDSEPQKLQVKMLEENLKIAMKHRYLRGKVSKKKLIDLLCWVSKRRVEEYSAEKTDEKRKIMCILGPLCSGRTLSSLHLRYHLGANVICAFTTKEPTERQVEGRDYHFIDILPDPLSILSYSHYNGDYYYSIKEQVFGPCTVYATDPVSYQNLLKDNGDKYRIFTVLLRRDILMRKRIDVPPKKVFDDDEKYKWDEKNYDFVIDNNGGKKHLFTEIERIYNTIKNM